MTHLIEVAFKGNRKEFFHWEADEPPALGAPVIVDADRGEDLGRVHSTGELAQRRSRGQAAVAAAADEGETPPPRRALRLATTGDVARGADLGEQNEQARRKAMERVRANRLVMKVSDAEWQWDRKKLTFYFTADKRVDFRTLVRELAATFRTRIELKQIGVRDEARRLDGVGRCGRQYCSASWLPELRPVNLGVAKDQRLSLNPLQISGACGRLMCCLRYEHDFYVQSRRRFPKEGRIIVTKLGEEKVLANDIFNDRVTLRGSEGDVRVVPLADLRAELAEVGSVPLVSEREADEAAEDGRAHASDDLPDDGDRGGRGARPAPRRPRSLPTVNAGRPATAPSATAAQRPAPTPVPADALLDGAARAVAATAAVPTESGDGAGATATPAADAGDAERRGRRRRGRRGGRRGRSASDGGSDAQSGDAASDDPAAPDDAAVSTSGDE